MRALAGELVFFFFDFCAPGNKALRDERRARWRRDPVNVHCCTRMTRDSTTGTYTVAERLVRRRRRRRRARRNFGGGVNRSGRQDYGV